MVERLVLPAGAEGPVKNVVAGRILEIMLQDKIAKRSTMDEEDEDESSSSNTKNNNNLESEAILDLVTKFPAVCQQKYRVKVSDGRVEEVYPLFVLLHLKPDLTLVEKVFEAHPEAIFRRHGYRPIDIACEMNASLDVVKFLHYRNPDAIRTPVRDGRYPLHVALSFYRPEAADVVNFLLDTYPEAASKQDKRRHYPSHHAAFGGAPVAIFERLHQICPESAAACDDKDWTSLHYACRYGRRSNHDENLSVIEYLVKVAPVALSIRNQGGWTPVMTGVGHETPEVISFLLNHIPNIEEVNGRSMLHLAAKHNCADSVAILAERFPWMLTAHGDHSGGTPLHYACKRNDDAIDIVEVLIKHNRRALVTTDRQGRLPLNWAFRINPKSEITKLLMKETAKGI